MDLLDLKLIAMVKTLDEKRDLAEKYRLALKLRHRLMYFDPTLIEDMKKRNGNKLKQNFIPGLDHTQHILKKKEIQLI